MEYIRVSNLRSLADTGRIELKPLSLLVGANSSGKSTFLRIFPLLKQSHEIRSLGGLVLNEGDVNFGFFNEALRKGAEPPELKFEFGFALEKGLYQGASWNAYFLGTTDVVCELVYVAREHDSRYARLRRLSLTLKMGDATDSVIIEADEDGLISEFRVNDLIATDEEKGALKLLIRRGLVPELIFAAQDDDLVDRGSNPFDRRLLSETASSFHGRTLTETRLATFQDIRVGSPQEMLDIMRSTGAFSWRDRAKSWNVSSSLFQKVRNLILARRMNQILDSVNVYVAQLANSVYYFQPVRATAQRDYLSRDVSVAAVDASGSNVAMVLQGMAPNDQFNFRKWMRQHLGFEVFPQIVGDGARVALRMKDEKTGTEFNLADTGFGFSQMLPFLVQLWTLIEEQPGFKARWMYPPPRRRLMSIPSSFIVAIEQPELHLHPALQASLADLIVAVVALGRQRGLPIRFVLETHSPTIVERIGQAIEAKLLDPSDAQVILFEMDRDQPTKNISKVCTTAFDSSGVLVDWPFGFFSAPLLLPPQGGSGAE
ncbi:MAG TPA: AAA family ATPase [Acidobacteriaceae bacterium]|nr:AAA family ATPase [Acidobacteriaceae bacterium]